MGVKSDWKGSNYLGALYRQHYVVSSFTYIITSCIAIETVIKVIRKMELKKSLKQSKKSKRKKKKQHRTSRIHRKQIVK